MTELISFQQVRECYRRIAAHEDRHGDFLTLFAQALLHADSENFSFLMPTAVVFIGKYNLIIPTQEEST